MAKQPKARLHKDQKPPEYVGNPAWARAKRTRSFTMRVTPELDRLILHMADNPNKWGLGSRFHTVAWRLFMRGVSETLKDSGELNDWDVEQLVKTLKATNR